MTGPLQWVRDPPGLYVRFNTSLLRPICGNLKEKTRMWTMRWMWAVHQREGCFGLLITLTEPEAYDIKKIVRGVGPGLGRFPRWNLALFQLFRPGSALCWQLRESCRTSCVFTYSSLNLGSGDLRISTSDSTSLLCYILKSFNDANTHSCLYFGRC